MCEPVSQEDSEVKNRNKEIKKTIRDRFGSLTLILKEKYQAGEQRTAASDIQAKFREPKGKNKIETAKARTERKEMFTHLGMSSELSVEQGPKP